MARDEAVIQEFEALEAHFGAEIERLHRAQKAVTGLVDVFGRAQNAGRIEALEGCRDRVAAVLCMWRLITEAERMPVASEREPLAGRLDCPECHGNGRIPMGPGRKDMLCNCSVAVLMERVARPCPQCVSEASTRGQLVGCSTCDNWARSVREWNEAAEGVAHAATLQTRRIELKPRVRVAEI